MNVNVASIFCLKRKRNAEGTLQPFLHFFHLRVMILEIFYLFFILIFIWLDKLAFFQFFVFQRSFKDTFILTVSINSWIPVDKCNCTSNLVRAARFFSTSCDSYLIFKSLNCFGLRAVLISQRIFSHMFVLYIYTLFVYIWIVTTKIW